MSEFGQYPNDLGVIWDALIEPDLLDRLERFNEHLRGDWMKGARMALLLAQGQALPGVRVREEVPPSSIKTYDALKSLMDRTLVVIEASKWN